MCEFCKNIAMNDDEYMKKRYDGGDFICRDAKDGFGLFVDTGDSGCPGYIKINYCPMCGKELAGENEKEKIKITSDGETAKIFIDGKKVSCHDMELHFSGHAGKEPMIVIDANWIKTDENNVPMLNEEKIGVLTEGIKINC